MIRLIYKNPFATLCCVTFTVKTQYNQVKGGAAMAKISKNIKTLRTERGMTQDALAEKINVTRQTVSSWENDRTQPDINMLELLSEAFGVSFEELIYGKKRNVGLEAPKSDKRKIANITLATAGSVLVASGLLILLITVWSDLPDFIIAAMTFIPLICGLAIAAFAKFRKAESTAWREGASVAWSIGLIATVFLIAGAFGTTLDFTSIFLIAAFLILPIMYILGSLFPLTAYYVTVIFWMFEFFYNHENALWAVLVPLIPGIAVTLKSKETGARKHYLVWLTVLASITSVTALAVFTQKCEIGSIFSVLLACFSALYAADKEGDFPYPFRYISAIAITVMLGILYTDSFSIDVMSSSNPNTFYIAPFICAAFIAAGIYHGRDCLKRNPIKAIFTATGVAASALIGFSAEMNIFDSEDVEFISMILLAAAAILLIINGIRKEKLLTVNFGLIALCYIPLTLMIKQMFDAAVCGVTFAAMGIALLLINAYLSKAFKAKERAENE